MDNSSDKDNAKEKKPPKKGLKRFFKFLLVLMCALVIISLIWVTFSLIGRVNAASAIPADAALRISISNPMRLVDNVLSHESLPEITALPAFAELAPILDMLQNHPLMENRLLRFAARGNIEFALLASETGGGNFAAVWDMGLFSPLLRVLPAISGFVDIPNLYYVQTGRNSRFEFRLDGMTLFIGPYRNLFFITDSSSIFEARSSGNDSRAFNDIRPSAYDAAFALSNEFISDLLAEQDPAIAAIMNNIEFDSIVEAGISIQPKKIQFHLAAPVSSNQQSLSHIIGQRSSVPVIAERIPADAQYATILSAGTLNELYQAALIFSPELTDVLRSAETASRFLLGLTLDDLLFSWTGNEFAVIGLEGRPHPVYAIQVSDERRRQEVFDRAFRTILFREDVRLNLDGFRIPRIEMPEFLQSLLRQWNVFLPSPYYIIYRDFLLASESADALLAALRSMQRNDVLPRTAEWREIAGGRTTASAISLYYSLDVSIPFFLRGNTVLTSFLSLYRQGLIRISFDRGVLDFSFALVPGSGSGVTLASGYPLNIGVRPSNRIDGTGRGGEGWIFYSSGGSAFSLNMTDNSIHELPGQGNHWVIYADGVGAAAHAWVVTDRGRVTLVNNKMEAASGFPILTGLRLSSPPAAYGGRVYLCDESGKVLAVDENGRQSVWETVFPAAVRSPPSFLTISTRNFSNTYAAVYPRTFSGEIWLLDIDGNLLPNWPAPVSIDEDDFGISFGSPHLFAHNNSLHVAFVTQTGQLIIYDENADVVFPFPVILDGIFFQQPVFDGNYLWLVSSEGNLFKVSLSGEVLSQHIQDFSVMQEGFITVFDYNNDRVPEIFITGEGNALYGFTRNFRSLEGFPLPAWGRPFFVPGHGGRNAEIFGIGMSARLYRWQFR